MVFDATSIGKRPTNWIQRLNNDSVFYTVVFNIAGHFMFLKVTK